MLRLNSKELDLLTLTRSAIYQNWKTCNEFAILGHQLIWLPAYYIGLPSTQFQSFSNLNSVSLSILGWPGKTVFCWLFLMSRAFSLKITGSLSDGLWNASMDTKFQESREAMRAERFSSSKDHFVAGVKGLGMGIVGGLTSIVTQPIEGAQSSGLSVSSSSDKSSLSISDPCWAGIRGN